MSTIQRTCCNKQCNHVFTARTADVKRGWAKFCSKSCKAVEQEGRTGQYRVYKERQHSMHDEAMCANEAGWDGHKNAF